MSEKGSEIQRFKSRRPRKKSNGCWESYWCGVRVIKDIIGQVRRNPSVRAWAQSKREEKARLRRTGLSGSDLRQALRQWVSNNPKPRGSDPTNTMDLGRSNQSNGDANSNIGTFVGVPNIPQTKKQVLTHLQYMQYWVMLCIQD